MNHNWADQYARQRFDELSREVRGDQLLRMSQSERDATSPKASLSTVAKLRLMLANLTAVK